MIVDESPTMEMVKSLRKIHERGIIERKPESRGQELGMGIKCATIATRETIFNIIVIS